MPLPLFDVNQAMKGTWESGGAANDKNLLQTIRDIEQCVYRNASSRFMAPLSYPPPPPPLRLPVNDNNTTTKNKDIDDDESDLSINSPRSRDGDEEECQDHWAWTTDQTATPGSPSLGDSLANSEIVYT